MSSYLPLTGGTLSGSIIVEKDNAGVSVNDTTVAHKISLASNDGNAGIYDNTNTKWILKSDSTGVVTLAGASSHAVVTATNPSTATTYRIPFISGTSSGNRALLVNDGFAYYTREGTADTDGIGYIFLGNNKDTGTAGNKRGCIRLYSNSESYANIYSAASLGSNVTITFPAKGGTVALTSDFSDLRDYDNTWNGVNNFTDEVNMTSTVNMKYWITIDKNATCDINSGIFMNNNRFISSGSDSAGIFICATASGTTATGSSQTYNFAPTAFRPGKNDDVGLGDSSRKWKQLFAVTSTISTSDRNLKDNINELTDIHKKLFMKLIPVSFTFKDGTSGRTHIGFISQDVEDAMNELGMNSLDFAGFCKDVKTKSIIETRPSLKKDGTQKFDENGNPVYEEIDRDIPDLDENGNIQYVYSLRYEEFIGLVVHVLQDSVNRLNSIEERLSKLESNHDI